MGEQVTREATRVRLGKEQAPITFATITAWPEEVGIDLNLGTDPVLSASQAREFANALLAAADESERIEWVDSEDGDLRVRDKA